jgi:hypothetical protein
MLTQASTASLIRQQHNFFNANQTKDISFRIAQLKF